MNFSIQQKAVVFSAFRKKIAYSHTYTGTAGRGIRNYGFSHASVKKIKNLTSEYTYSVVKQILKLLSKFNNWNTLCAALYVLIQLLNLLSGKHAPSSVDALGV